MRSTITPEVDAPVRTCHECRTELSRMNSGRYCSPCEKAICDAEFLGDSAPLLARRARLLLEQVYCAPRSYDSPQDLMVELITRLDRLCETARIPLPNYEGAWD